MKKVLFLLIMFFCFVIAGYKCFFYFDSVEEKTEIDLHTNKVRLDNKDLLNIKEGDFILRRGFGFFSDFISKSLNTGFIDVTHAGIIVNKNGALHVIHSLSSDVSAVDGVQIQLLSDFLRHSAPGKIMITRIKSEDALAGTKIAQMAGHYLDERIPFDHQGKFDDAKEFFCTELIWNILEQDLNMVTLPTTYNERKKFFYSMEPLYNPAMFHIILNQYRKR